jgi:hypothetical protein
MGSRDGARDSCERSQMGFAGLTTAGPGRQHRIAGFSGRYAGHLRRPQIVILFCTNDRSEIVMRCAMCREKLARRRAARHPEHAPHAQIAGIPQPRGRRAAPSPAAGTPSDREGSWILSRRAMGIPPRAGAGADKARSGSHHVPSEDREMRG